MRRFALPACALWMLWSCLPAGADAQVRRCETPDGRTVYTDKHCADIGAAERVPRAATGAGAQASLHRARCSRTLQELTFELTMAIDARDANRLAALYHWPGTATRTGYAIMERLDAIASRGLVDVRPLLPADDPAPVAMAAPSGTTAPDPGMPPSSAALMQQRQPWRPSPSTAAQASPMPAGADDANVGAAAPVQPAPSRRRVPYALQVDQTLANGSTPSRTVFGLRRHLGCWWVSF